MILVIRRDCRGDVLVATSVLPGLRQQYPREIIHFLCSRGYDDLLLHNPYIDKIVYDAQPIHYTRVIDLNHHNIWDDHMARVHCRIANVPFSPPEIYLMPAEVEKAQGYAGCIALAADAGWLSRRYRHWNAVTRALQGSHRVVQIDAGPRVEHCERFKGTIREAVAVLSVASLYLGIDTVFMHAAAALCVPMVLAMGPTGKENQYVPCSLVVRPYPFTSAEDARYNDSIDFDPALLVHAVQLMQGAVLVQGTGPDGR